WAERAMLAVNAAFPENARFPHVAHSTWPQYERLLAHALLAAQRIMQDQIIRLEAGQLLSQTACYLGERACYSEAELLFQRALTIREQQLGPEHPDVAYSLAGLEHLYAEQGKYAQAESLCQRALAIREQQLGPEHSHVASLLDTLANLYAEQGK